MITSKAKTNTDHLGIFLIKTITSTESLPMDPQPNVHDDST